MVMHDQIKGWTLEKRGGLRIYHRDGGLIYIGSPLASEVEPWFRDIDDDLAVSVLWWLDQVFGRDRGAWASFPINCPMRAVCPIPPGTTVRV